MSATTDYRPELPAMTERIARLPVHRGYPVPWFVAWLDESGSPLPRGEGEPDFRVLAPDSLERAYFGSVCWICGEFRGRYASFVAGPMCGINRTSAEPPSHPECAGWAACACPFLARPHARRREAGLPDGTVEPGGIALLRNPGVALVWSSRDWRRWVPPGGGYLYDIGTPRSHFGEYGDQDAHFHVCLTENPHPAPGYRADDCPAKLVGKGRECVDGQTHEIQLPVPRVRHG